MLQNIWEKLLFDQSKWLILLTPFSFLWDLIYRIRRFLYDGYIFKRVTSYTPVISVGNIVLGGSGKTPLTLYIAKYIEQKLQKPLISMQGYRGRYAKSSGFLDKENYLTASSHDFGDEALIYARRLQNPLIVVGKNRLKNLYYYFKKAQPDVIIMDDGYQYLNLNKDLDIVLFDALRPVEDYKIFPRGYLRENLKSLIDADIVGISRIDMVTPEKLKELEGLIGREIIEKKLIIYFKYIIKKILNLNKREEASVEQLKTKKVIVFSGVASPRSFYHLLEEQGIEIFSSYTFKDHHFYTQGEVETICTIAEREDAFILTTEKDIVKLVNITKSPRIFCVEIEIEILKGKIKFHEKIDKILYN